METRVDNPASNLPPIVLLVEDDAETRELYRTALEFAGLWVAQTGEPADALDYALDLRPDAVLMDLAVPTLSDGVELARAMRQSARTAETPLLAVTDVNPHAVRAAAPLFTAVFYKPVRLEHLVRRVRWLSTRAAILAERSARARARGPALAAKAHELVDRSRELRRQHREIRVELHAQTERTPAGRTCPRCRRPLQFSESRILEGTTFDYYLPCRNGCGLFCYDHARRALVTLIG